MVVFPNAKINLGLCVTEKRNDGYHNIESIFYPIPFNDILETGYFPNESNKKLACFGVNIEGNDENNLILKAYQLLHGYLEQDKKLEIEKLSFALQKIIPTGAGLGGGSADGTFTLKMINQFLDLKISDTELEKLALQLGSDCPFFVKNQPAFVRGRGEILEPVSIDISNYNFVLIHPGIHVSTADAYQNISPSPANMDWNGIGKKSIKEWKNILRNDFEKTVFEKHPEIKSIKEILYDLGAEFAQMSGSGSAVFGLFKNEISKDTIQKNFPTHYSIFTCSLAKK